MHNKPYAESSEENKQVILQVLQRLFTRSGQVLEIASGTGQHAVHFARHLPHLTWQPTDRTEQIPGIMAWLEETGLDNILPARELDVSQLPWQVDSYDYLFSANSVHIMSWDAVQCFYSGLKSVLKSGGLFALYGPFNYDGRYTSDSNARFDQWLKQRDPLSGIRDFNQLDRLAKKNGLDFVEDIEMPVNNRILVWKRV